ncbi:uncharacterized protein LOC114309561 [Camellia sinensis]|uniref:uncharacterized protein LOC114309561 n=1 Tax=Camellia sinensis TaxID=4442 RepID=UPI0010368C6C|nr:uncharacterized protein LOC114309561 [Camellia sinensis]
MALVEIECKASWSWFLEELMSDIGSVKEIGWTFISNKQMGLVETFAELYPTVNHKYCLRHMYSNFKTKYSGCVLIDLFWKATSTGNVHEFNYWMKKIEKADPKTGNKKTTMEWLRETDLALWARSHFSPRSKCDILVNNLSESFNSYILKARKLPIIFMFEWIKRKLMQRIQVKKAGMAKYSGEISPNIHDKLEKLKVESRNYFATCHVISAIQINHEQLEAYMHEYYSKSRYLDTYAFIIHPVPDMYKYEESSQKLNSPERFTSGQSSQPASTPTPTPTTNIPSNESTKLPTHGGKTSSGLGKGPEITVGGRGRELINASASAINVGRTGVNANVRGLVVSITSVLETIKARR